MSPYNFPPAASRFKSLLYARQLIKYPFPILNRTLSQLGTTYTFYMGGVQKCILTANPGAVRHLLQKNHKAYEKAPIVTDLLAKYIGKGLLTSSGDYWLRQRRLIQPGFHKRRIESLQSLMTIEVNDCMDRWSAKTSSDTRFDAYEEMHLLTFSIVARTLFSTQLEDHGLVQLSHLISTLQSFIVKEVRQPYLRWWFQCSGQIHEHLTLAEEARKIIRNVISKRKKSTERPDDLLTMLLESKYEDTGLGMDEDQLIDECLIFFVAGHETACNTLCWMIYLLGKHPGYLMRLQEADKESQDILIRNAIQETLRLYPPGWVLVRISKEDDKVLDYSVPKGTVWIMYIRAMQRLPEYWKDGDEFIPDRWNEPDINKDAYMPFGAGPRLCIGEHYAMMEMQLIISSIIRLWDFQLHSKEIKEKPLITLRPLGEVLISIKPRV